jgi:hypothetical protein
METVATPAEPPHSPDTGAASAWLDDIGRDLTALSEVAECGMVVMRDLADRVNRGEFADAVMAVDRLSRAIRRTIALKMRLRAEAVAAMRGQYMMPDMMPARAVTVPAEGEAKPAGRERGDMEYLLGDLYDRADAAERGDEIGNTPSADVYRSVCKVLGVTPDETLFRRDAQPVMAPAAAATGEVAVMERARERGPAVRDRPPRAGNGRDPPRSG